MPCLEYSNLLTRTMIHLKKPTPKSRELNGFLPSWPELSAVDLRADFEVVCRIGGCSRESIVFLLIPTGNRNASCCLLWNLFTFVINDRWSSCRRVVTLGLPTLPTCLEFVLLMRLASALHTPPREIPNKFTIWRCDLPSFLIDKFASLDGLAVVNNCLLFFPSYENIKK